MRKNLSIILLSTLFISMFFSCLSEKRLAQKCTEQYPCITTKIDTIIHRTDTTIQQATYLQPIGVRCLEWIKSGDLSIEIYDTCQNEVKTIEKTIETQKTVLYSSRLKLLQLSLDSIQKEYNSILSKKNSLFVENKDLKKSKVIWIILASGFFVILCLVLYIVWLKRKSHF